MRNRVVAISETLEYRDPGVCHVSLEDYSVSNRGLRSGLIGTPGQIAERIAEFESVGVDLLLLQCSPQFEEMERFAANIIPAIDP